MAKWADYLISQVLYDQNHIITKVKQHRDIGNKISGGEIVDRDALANNLGHGVKYMTVYGDLGKIRMGKNVRYFRAYEDHYIRIDDNKVMTDNLGELPGLVESQQEEQPVLAEAKPKPAVETKPLSELSSAFFSEQVEQEPLRNLLRRNQLRNLLRRNQLRNLLRRREPDSIIHTNNFYVRLLF